VSLEKFVVIKRTNHKVQTSKFKVQK